MIYLDTSFVIPLYWPEALSDLAEALVAQESGLIISNLVEVEFVSALSRRVRMREIPKETAKLVSERFSLDIKAKRFTRLDIQTKHYDLPKDWLNRFDTPLRTLDALHLAIAATECLDIVTADRGLAESASKVDVICRWLHLVDGENA